MLSSGIANGIRTARMVLGKPIPSALFIAGERMFTSYPGQPCGKCGDEGHMAATCKSVHCFNCELSGHRADDCEMDVVCGICRDIDYTSVACPFLRYCANVKPVAPGTVSYANVTKTLAAASRPKENSLPTVAVPLLNVSLPKDLRDKHDQTKKAMDSKKDEESKKVDGKKVERDSEWKDSEPKEQWREKKSESVVSERRGDRERERERDRSGYQRDRDRDHEHDRQRDRDYKQYHRERS